MMAGFGLKSTFSNLDKHDQVHNNLIAHTPWLQHWYCHLACFQGVKCCHRDLFIFFKRLMVPFHIRLGGGELLHSMAENCLRFGSTCSSDYCPIQSGSVKALHAMVETCMCAAPVPEVAVMDNTKQPQKVACYDKNRLMFLQRPFLRLLSQTTLGGGKPHRP